jgi:glutamine amidotransferase-like uncharacterized protein
MSNILLYDDIQTRLRTPLLKKAVKRDIDCAMKNTFFCANRHEFVSAISTNPRAIFIAENIGVKSHHMRDISPDAIKAMKTYAHHGGTLVFFGGASHYAMTEITWYWDNQTITYKGPKETFSLVNGKIIGPHHRLPLSSDSRIDHNGCFEVPLLVHGKSNQLAIESCWQGNCGNFIISEDRVQQNYEILATYAQAGKHQGVAALDIPVGNKGGNIILCSVMPHYNPRHESPLWDRILTKVESKISRHSPQAVLKRAP